MGEFQERKAGLTTIYSFENCCANLDYEKCETTDNGQQFLKNLKKIEETFGIKPERVFCSYFGSTQKDVRVRVSEHCDNPRSPFFYFKTPPEITFHKKAGFLDYKESEYYEKLYLESFQSLYTSLFIDKGIFYWPMGPFNQKEKGRCQREHPYIDNNKGYVPRWLRELYNIE